MNDRVLCYALQLRDGKLIKSANHTHPDLVCRNADEAADTLAGGTVVYWPVAEQKAIESIEQAAIRKQRKA